MKRLPRDDHSGAGKRGDGVQVGTETVGISLTSTSRTMPPPIPVSIPRRAAMKGFRSKESAFWDPTTANNATFRLPIICRDDDHGHKPFPHARPNVFDQFDTICCIR